MSTENISEDDLFGPGEFPLYPAKSVEQTSLEILEEYLSHFEQLGVKVIPVEEAEQNDADTTRGGFGYQRSYSFYPVRLPDSPDDEL